LHAFRAPITHDPLRSRGGDHTGTTFLEHGPDQLPEFGWNQRLQRIFLQIAHRDRHSHLSERGRHLTADETPSDDDHLPRPAYGRPDSIAIVDRAQCEHTGEIGPRERETPGPTASGQQELAIADALAARQRDAPAAARDARGLGARQHRDAMLSIE